MIQRIQTLYLLIVAIIATALNFLSLGAFKTQEGIYTLDSLGIKELNSQEILFSTWALFAILSSIAIISLIAVFLYKKRVIQMRLAGFSILLWVGFLIAYALFAITIKKEINAEFSIEYILALPLVGIVLDWMAIRSIGSDEALVRSLDRIR
ncbi:MAG: DUF4293 domain-containing protein [Bacteroidales bacterium]